MSKDSIATAYKELKSMIADYNPEDDPGDIKRCEDYFQTFNSPHGHRVLEDMLIDLKVFDSISNEEDAVLANYGRILLNKIGILREGNFSKIIKDYMSMARVKYEQRNDLAGKTARKA
jgi:DNA integrity scanning protein DisA with diadenylate cyclase activity